MLGARLVAGCLAVGLGVGAVGCSQAPPQPPAPLTIHDTVVVVDTVEVQKGVDPNPELEQRVARLQIQLLEREAQLTELERRRDDAVQEVVRTMSKLQTLASRAEAASAMAEAEVAADALRKSAATAPELRQVRRLLDMSGAAFNEQNFGGALYLATQARNLAQLGRQQRAGGDQGSLRPGEAAFAVQPQLETVRRANVRDGPSTDAKVLFTLEASVAVTGYSHTDQWVRVKDASGRTGWVFHNLVRTRAGGGK